MATPIGKTPSLEGREATEFLNRMFEPPTEKEKEISNAIKSQRKVFLWEKPSEK